jgi:hypothetical protein
MPLPEWLLLAEKTYTLYREAGAPADVRDVSGMPLILTLVTLWHSRAQLAGQMGGPAEAAFWAEAGVSFGQHAGLGYGIALSYAVLCEPPGSSIVTRLAQERSNHWSFLKMVSPPSPLPYFVYLSP